MPPQLASQLSGQLTSLRALPQGDHVLTLTVNPESFGPVKVVAHIGSDGVHLEIFGASEQARAALRAALPDLRRDLAGVGLDPRLDVGGDSSGDARDESAMTDPHGFGDKQAGRAAANAAPRGATDAPVPVSASPLRVARQGGIDLDL
jgi:flagellar hook-length control protein FliK